MTLHLGFELPQKKEAPRLDAEAPEFTPEEIRIVKRQITSNGKVIHEMLMRLDLLVNREKYPHQAVFIEKIRRQLFLLMEENDTFRKVLLRHITSGGAY